MGLSKSKATGNSHSAEIRDWAKARGYDVADRGKLPTNVVEAYNEDRAEQASIDAAVPPVE